MRISGWMAPAVLGLALGARADATNLTLRAAAEARGVLVGAATMSDTLRDPRHRDTLAREFNLLTPENEMKWAFLRRSPDAWDFTGADRLLAFAEEHKLAVHGHTLLWYAHNPKWLAEKKGTPAEMEQLMVEHIRKVVGRYRGRVRMWDVINEEVADDGTLRDSLWSRAGTNYIARAFRTAHEADPKAHLVYNDYGTEEVNRKSDGVYALLKRLKAEGVPVHGVGFQCHVSGNGPNLESFARNLERFAALGLDLHLTEIDVRLKVPATAEDYARQARVYRGLVETALKNPRMKSITTWGVSDARSWVPSFFKGQGDALPFDREYRPKPAHEAMRQALMERGDLPATPASSR